MFAQFRILPLLIFVAMLAFSVRLAEVITGVSHLSGSAQAETADKEPEAAKDDKPAEETAKKESAKEEAIADNKKAPEKSEAASAEQEITQGSEEVQQEDTKESAPDWRDAGDSNLDVTAVKMEVMEDVARRSAKLDQQQKSLNAREALLKATEQEIDRKYQEMTKLRTEIEGLLGKQSEEEEKRIVSLVKIYEGMKPKEAARIFDTLDLDILVSVVSKMSERKISPILGLMSPERAKTLTIMLAEQKQLPTLGQ